MSPVVVAVGVVVVTGLLSGDELTGLAAVCPQPDKTAANVVTGRR